jgi:hypothetical protein
MSVEAARVAMETEFPDAPLDVLEESSTHTMVVTCVAAHIGCAVHVRRCFLVGSCSVLQGHRSTVVTSSAAEWSAS